MSAARLDTILAQIDALGSQLAALRAYVVAGEEDDEHIDARQSLERFGVGRDGLLAAERRGELNLSRGPRGKILVTRSALEEYLRRPHAPTKPRRRKVPTEAADYDASVRHELQLLAGGRR